MCMFTAGTPLRVPARLPPLPPPAGAGPPQPPSSFGHGLPGHGLLLLLHLSLHLSPCSAAGPREARLSASAWRLPHAAGPPRAARVKDEQFFSLALPGHARRVWFFALVFSERLLHTGYVISWFQMPPFISCRVILLAACRINSAPEELLAGPNPKAVRQSRRGRISHLKLPTQSRHLQ